MENPKTQKELIINQLKKYFNFNTELYVFSENRMIPAKTRVFLNDEKIQSAIILKDDELPILEFHLNKDDFFVFTTKRLYLLRDGLYLNMTYDDLKKYQLIDKQTDIDSELIAEGRKNRVQFLDFKIRLKDESSYKLRVENGNVFHLVMLIFQLLL